MSKFIEFEILENFRDLGGFPCAYGETSFGVIYRSASPFYGTSNDIEQVKQLGVKTVLDLRGPKAWEYAPNPFKAFSDVDVVELDAETNDLAKLIEKDIALGYMALASNVYSARRVFQTLIHAKKPVLMHCESGKDRTGVFSLLLLLANGVSREDAENDYLESYDHLVKTEARIRSVSPDLPSYHFTKDPAMIHRFIDMFFERYGDMERYFENIGLNDEEICAICNLFGKEEVSAGVIVFRQNRVQIIHSLNGDYGFAKGHTESEDADLCATAKREVNEETGAEVRILDGFHAEQHYSYRPGILKTVHWFVGETETLECVPQEGEVADVYFLSPADAMRVLTYDSSRKLLADACKFYFDEE